METKLNNFIEKATPIWFNWLGWFLSVGAVGFVAEKTQLISVFVVYGISYVFFFMYITYVISKLVHLKLFKHEAINKTLMTLLAISVMALSTITLNQAVTALVSNG